MDKDLTTAEEKHLESLVRRYGKLQAIREQILKAYLVLRESYQGGGKILTAGNGGSAADAEHIVGELMKRFVLPRPISAELAKALEAADPIRGIELAKKLEAPLTAVALTAHEALSTAYANDVDGKLTFAQQLLGFGRKGDVFLGITTSGSSANIINAAVLAKAMGIRVIGLTGRDGGELKKYSESCVIVPEQETYLIQELHLPIYHCWCMMLEAHFFS